MDSELLSVVFFAFVVVTAIATLIQWPGGTTSLIVSLTFSFIASCCIGIVFGIVSQWGQAGSGAVYFLWILFLFLFVAGVSTFIRHVLYPSLPQLEYFTVFNIAAVLCFLFILFRFAFYAGQYDWQIIELSNSYIKILDMYPIKGINLVDDRYSLYFSRRWNVDDRRRLLVDHYPHPDDGNIYRGLPRSLSFSFYVPNRNKLYSIDSQLPYKHLNKIPKWRWLYPFYRKQQFNYIELLLSDSGEVALFISNLDTSLEVYRGMATEIGVDDLSRSARRAFDDIDDAKINKKESKSETTDITAYLLKKPFKVQHRLSGFAEKIIDVNVLSLNGERYRLPIKPGADFPFSRIATLPRYIVYYILNENNQLVECTYSYDPDALVKFLTELDSKGKILDDTEIIYYLELKLSETGYQLLNFEYVDGEKYEFKMDANMRSAEQ